MSGILCAGDVYFDRLDASGASTGLIFLFDAKRFALNEPSEDVDRITRGRDNFGQLGDTVKIKQPATLEIDGDDIPAQVLAMAVLGEAAAATQVSGTVSDAATTLKHDVWTQLPHGYINDAGFAAEHTSGTPVYVENTDYRVNRRLGLIMALSTGAIANNQSVNLSYGYAAATGHIISGGSTPIVKGRVLLDGKNLANQRDLVVDVDEWTGAPREALDFASGEYIAARFGGKMRTLPGKTSPYTIQYR